MKHRISWREIFVVDHKHLPMLFVAFILIQKCNNFVFRDAARRHFLEETCSTKKRMKTPKGGKGGGEREINSYATKN